MQARCVILYVIRQEYEHAEVISFIGYLQNLFGNTVFSFVSPLKMIWFPNPEQLTFGRR